MNTETLYKTPAGEKVVMDFYDAALARWPVPYTTLNLDTRYGRTFVIASGDPAAPPQLRFSPSGSFEGAFVVSGDGQVQWLVPGPPPLPAKPIPGRPMELPEIKGALSKGQPAVGAF